jgi:hypothetical protein
MWKKEDIRRDLVVCLARLAYEAYSYSCSTSAALSHTHAVRRVLSLPRARSRPVACSRAPALCLRACVCFMICVRVCGVTRADHGRAGALVARPVRDVNIADMMA